ncbi:T. brucei spp.-specific protein [Trypanosoma brucei gambiense DAL972]|uniref:T. brucei spp.-specific protein n=2 Tax=Trypanosoma brucei TaxID=5691 RepID=Q389D9_TRYB2|nr:T. brucei spp.-specific protein [Trypanosoma brucei gambiense DAL972]XP_823409.1 hypothetical protein, conserved [Trypanosoma brucei brucei TREU927]EAN78581.1 hypothetical protein, conserved [Trypanosoma brucei brucei TREU927]CBH16350.1 T. brucei spp.-specific protein [Trypanosoma brucei gambiense DAL972]|eukprot:XP_011778614.1 T. brucei spp.-specific protein [Trypanosoma brucei gambiense DAL972]
MLTIRVGNLPVCLCSNLRNTFNPTYAFGVKRNDGTVALLDGKSGHLLLPFDAEGNIIVTPGADYQLVFLSNDSTSSTVHTTQGLGKGGTNKTSHDFELTKALAKDGSIHREKRRLDDGRATSRERFHKGNAHYSVSDSKPTKRRKRDHSVDKDAVVEAEFGSQSINKKERSVKASRKDSNREDSDDPDDIPIFCTLAGKPTPAPISSNHTPTVSPAPKEVYLVDNFDPTTRPAHSEEGALDSSATELISS